MLTWIPPAGYLVFYTIHNPTQEPSRKNASFHICHLYDALFRSSDINFSLDLSLLNFTSSAVTQGVSKLYVTILYIFITSKDMNTQFLSFCSKKRKKNNRYKCQINESYHNIFFFSTGVNCASSWLHGTHPIDTLILDKHERAYPGRWLPRL